jgi:hypothetical protein
LLWPFAADADLGDSAIDSMSLEEALTGSLSPKSATESEAGEPAEMRSGADDETLAQSDGSEHGAAEASAALTGGGVGEGAPDAGSGPIGGLGPSGQSGGESEGNEAPGSIEMSWELAEDGDDQSDPVLALLRERAAQVKSGADKESKGNGLGPALAAICSPAVASR